MSAADTVPSPPALAFLSATRASAVPVFETQDTSLPESQPPVPAEPQAPLSVAPVSEPGTETWVLSEPSLTTLNDAEPTSFGQPPAILLTSPQLAAEPTATSFASPQLAPEPPAVLVASPQVAPEPPAVLVASPQVAPEPTTVLFASPEVASEPSAPLFASPQAAPEPTATLFASPIPESLPTPDPEPSVNDEWDAYLCSLRQLPSIKLQSEEGYSQAWDNLFDYYASELAVDATVESLSKMEPCAARAILGDMATLLDAAIAKEQSWWNWFGDPSDLALMQQLRRAL